MSINHLGNSFNRSPLSSGEAGLRLQPSESSVSINKQDSSRRQDDIVQTRAPIQSNHTKTRAAESVFRPIPSFDELPANLRNALQSYLTVEQTVEPASDGGSELLVGVDTFV